MKLNTPLITLLTGGALGIGLLIASTQATQLANAPTGYSNSATTSPTATSGAQAAATAPASTPATTPSSPASTSSSAAAAASAQAAASPPAKADYAGKVQGGGASVAISIHGSQAIAYICNDGVVEGWLKGTVTHGPLVLTGKNQARINVDYGSGLVSGNAVAHGTHYNFAVHTVHRPSGLYTVTALVRGAKIKAGWIVLPDGTQVGSVETNANSATPSAITAPMLDVATMTAVFEGVVLHAVQVSGDTGSGF